MLGHKLKGRSVLASLSILLLAACVPQQATSVSPVDVEVTLSDFKFASGLTTFEVGVPYHFILTNEGAVSHELMIMPPVDASPGMNMEELDEMASAHVDEDELPAGGSATLDYTFTAPETASELEFACRLPGHYEAGMKLPITVVNQ